MGYREPYAEIISIYLILQRAYVISQMPPATATVLVYLFMGWTGKGHSRSGWTPGTIFIVTMYRCAWDVDGIPLVSWMGYLWCHPGDGTPWCHRTP